MSAALVEATAPSVPLEPIPVPVDVPDGFWRRETTHAPEPHFPLNRIVFPLRRRATRRACQELGLLMEGIDMREIGGWEYARMIPLGGAKERPAPPRWIFWLAVRLHPGMRRRLRECADAQRSGTVERLIRRYWDEWRPELKRDMERLRSQPLEPTDASALDAHLKAVHDMLEHALDVHFRVALASMIAVGELNLTCRDLFGWDDPTTLRLVNGLSLQSSAPCRALVDLVGFAAARPDLVELLESNPTEEQIAQADMAFHERFQEYKTSWGHRALRYDVGEATLAERPELLVRLICNQLRQRYDPATRASSLEAERETALAEARALLQEAAQPDRERFEYVLSVAKRAYPVREDNVFHTVGLPLAVLRRGAQAAGRHLADHGLLDDVDDVFFLEWEELRSAIRDPSDQRALVARRRAEREWVLAHPGPETFGTNPGPPPDFGALPHGARLVMQALLHTMERVIPDEHDMPHDVRGTTVRGTPAAAGRYTGTVRVITGEHEFSKLRPGDVLVCPITSPVWSVLFPSVGALVTDTGGILSHPAIIAREFCVPAVVASGNATTVLRDGDVVTVDGQTGTVEVRERAGEHARWR